MKSSVLRKAINYTNQIIVIIKIQLTFLKQKYILYYKNNVQSLSIQNLLPVQLWYFNFVPKTWQKNKLNFSCTDLFRKIATWDFIKFLESTYVGVFFRKAAGNGPWHKCFSECCENIQISFCVKQLRLCRALLKKFIYSKSKYMFKVWSIRDCPFSTSAKLPEKHFLPPDTGKYSTYVHYVHILTVD